MGNYPVLGSIGFQMAKKMKKEFIKMVKREEYGSLEDTNGKKNIDKIDKFLSEINKV